MNSLQQIKLAKFNTNAEQTRASVARSIASLNNDLSAAIQHQAYARLNPDLTVDAGLLEYIGSGFEELLPNYSEINSKITDLMQVKAGTMTVEELKVKYPFDIDKYSTDLLK
jgi:hypothetical protein